MQTSSYYSLSPYKFLCIIFKKIIQTLFSFEFFFVLFLFSYQYKNALPEWSGPDVTFITGCLCVISGIWIWQHERIKRFWQLPTFLFSMFTAWIIFSFTQQPELTTYTRSKFWVFILFTMPTFFMTYCVIGGSNERTRRLFYGFVLFGLSVLSHAYYTYVHYGFQIKDILGNNYLVTGQTLSVCFLLITAWFYERYLTLILSIKILVLLILAILSFVSFNLGGRGPVIANLLALIVFCTYCYFYTKNKRQFSIACGWVIITVILGTWLQQWLWRIDQFHFTTRLAASMSHYTTVDQSLLSRFDYYHSAWQMLRDHPLQGVGFGRWPIVRLLHDEAVHPHNIFLEIGAELGFIGLSIFLLFVSSCLYRFKHQWQQASYMVLGSLMLFVFSFANAMKSGDINDNILLYAALGLLVGQTRSLKQITKIL